MYLHKAFGLCILSEWRLKQLIETDGEADIIIKRGSVPRRLESHTLNFQRMQMNKEGFLLQIDNVAKYYVEKGKTIIVEPDSSLNNPQVNLFLLGTTMASVLFFRKKLPLHGSVVCKDGEGILITGVSGAGKSTVASKLMKERYALVTDDLAAVDIRDDILLVYPSYPSQKLWSDAIKGNKYSRKEKLLNREKDGLNKYVIYDIENFHSRPVMLTKIFEIAISDNCHVNTIQKMVGAQKMGTILRNTFRKRMVKGLGLQKWYFNECKKTADNVDIYRITRSENGCSAEDTAKLIMKIMKEDRE